MHAPRPLKPLSKDRVATSLYGSDSCAYTSLTTKTNTPCWPYQINFTRLKFNLLNIWRARQSDNSPIVRP